MNSIKLKSLRRKQFIFLNAVIIILICLFSLLGPYIGLTEFYVGGGVILLTQGLLYHIFKSPPLALAIPFLRKLMTYENERLGEEAKKRYKLDANLILVMALLFLFQGWMNQGEPTTMSFEEIWPLFIGIFMVLITVLNISLFVHNRKVDHSEKKDLRGFTSRYFVFSFIIGLITVFLFIAFIVMYLLSKYF